METPTKEQYLLTSFKHLSTGIEINADIKMENGQQIFFDKDNRESKRIPHADLTNALNSLATDLAHNLGYEGEDQQNITMNGFAADGKGNKRNVTLKGMIESPSGKKFNIKSDKIYFISEIGKKVEKKVKVAIDEIYMYRWEDKKANLTIPFEQNVKSKSTNSKADKSKK